MRLAIAALLSLVLACNGTDGPAGLSALSRVDPEPAGPNCPAGGTVIRTGLDRDRDWTLDDGEVTSFEYVCDELGATLVLRQDVEPPGGNCADGGTALRAGLDADGDGALDDAEIAKTTYACGAPPAPPPATLTRVLEELPGAACPAGGTRVEAGPDADRDGVLEDLEVRTASVVCGAGPVRTRTRTAWLEECGGDGAIVESGHDVDVDGALDDEEVTTTSHVCGETAWLRYPVSTAEDVAFLDGVRRIQGSLVVQGSLLESMYLWFEVIDGSVEVLDNPGLTSFGLTVGLLGGDLRISGNPALEWTWIEPRFGKGLGGLRVPGHVTVEGNPKLRTPPGWGDLGWIGGSLVLRDNDALRLSDTLDQLRFVGGSVVVERNAVLESLALPALEWVLGDLTIQGNPSLEDTDGIGVPLVRHLGGRLVVKDNPVLRRAQFRYTESVGGLDLSNNPDLVNLWLPEVHAVNGDVIISGDAGFPAFSHDLLLVIDGSLVVADTPWPAFHVLSLARIGGDLRIVRNPNLMFFSLPDLVQVAGHVSIEDNAVLDGVPSSHDPESMGALETTGSLTVRRNPLLSRLALPSLSRAGSWVHVDDNPRLPTCQAEALVGQLEYAPPVSISGNDDLATCP